MTGFDALAEFAPQGSIPAIRAPREQVYVSLHDSDPELIGQETAETFGALVLNDNADLQARAIARITWRRWQSVSEAPAPLYVRAADAAPSKDLPPVLLDE